MIPKQAIEKAIEGGFKINPVILNEWGGVIMHDLACELTCDPSFWQALGKALEWSEEHFTSCAIWKTGECDCSAKDEWKEKAKEFYDLILERKDTTAFWEEILK